MSASLVGSEMCIRDRSCTALSSSGRSSLGMDRRSMRPMTKQTIGQALDACLLYTSDAADDM
eukprot:2962591-Alexandrium_andersonii.AAC.1